MSCCCCRRPRYQRLVDSIFSRDVEGQINQANLQQLLYLARSSPDKLDDIGKYLLAKLKSFIRSNRTYLCRQCLRITEELMDQCNNRTVSLLVKNLLPMMVSLLEPDNQELQMMAMDTLLKFKDKPEDRPTYQIEYDFIIERLTSLALPANKSTEVRLKAVECLSGLVVKVSRDKFYQVMVWEEVHLNKLVPVYLYRMKEEPDDSFLRSFVGTAEITHFPRLMAAVFEHFDNNHSWISDSGFVNTVMEIVVKATEVRMVHSIVESLLNHLGKHARNVLISTAIVRVLDKVVAMAAEGIAGPYLLDFLRTLVSHLKTNISQAHSSSENKVPLEKFQQELVKVIISCGESVPNYERWNIVCYLISQMPDVVAVETDIQLSRELMTMCSRVMKYIQMKNLDDIFSDQVYSSFKNLWKYTSSDLVPLVLLLWRQAMDWKGNSSKIPLNVSWSKLETAGLSHVDHKQYIFNLKYLQNFTQSISEFISVLPWERSHMEAYYRFVSVVPLSLGVEAGKSLVKVAMEIQDGPSSDSSCCRQFCHVTVAGMLHTLNVMMPGSLTWNTHVAEVLERRVSRARHLLPDGFFLGDDMLNITDRKDAVDEDLLFSPDQLQIQGLPTILRLPSISVYDNPERSSSPTAESVVLLASNSGDQRNISFNDIREGQVSSLEDSHPSTQETSFQEALTKEATIVHQQIANLLMSPLLTADDFGTETIELPEIH